jgi:hypothetical protein
VERAPPCPETPPNAAPLPQIHLDATLFATAFVTGLVIVLASAVESWIRCGVP